MKRYARTAAAGALALLPLGAGAAPVSYSYLEVGFVDSELSGTGGGDVEGDGPALRVSALMAPDVFVFGGFEPTEYDDGTNIDTLSAGAGLRFPMATQGRGPASADLYTVISLERLDFDAGAVSDDATGPGLRAGVRGAVSPELELTGEIHYANYGEIGTADVDALFLGLGGVVNVTPRFGIGLSYRTGEYDFDGADRDRDDLMLSARIHF